METLIIEKAGSKDAQEILKLQHLAYRIARNLHLYQKLGCRLSREEKVGSSLTLKYLEKIASPAESEPSALKDTAPSS
ncbi:MAG: hypothetical protein JW950_05805 [Deltaproteobacteria bacterium]|nr:hypothetical protein [Deltaproteobacteria bacterium]